MRLKLQKKILDNWSKDKINFNAQETEDSIFVTDNCLQVFVFPKDKFYLDLHKLMDGKTSIKMDQMIKSVEGENGYLTSEMKNTGKSTLVKIASENNHSWVDKKLLDRFEVKHGLHFTIPKHGEKCPSLVYEDEQLLGLILPVYVKE